jgi:hypothetical protein
MSRIKDIKRKYPDLNISAIAKRDPSNTGKYVELWGSGCVFIFVGICVYI